MDKDDPNRFIHDDPTATEVNDELRRAREKVERRAEAQRRRQWDAEHGPLDLNTVESEAWETSGELERGDE